MWACRANRCKTAGMTFRAHREQNAPPQVMGSRKHLTGFLTRFPPSSTSFSVWPTTTPALRPIADTTGPTVSSGQRPSRLRIHQREHLANPLAFRGLGKYPLRKVGGRWAQLPTGGTSALRPRYGTPDASRWCREQTGHHPNRGPRLRPAASPKPQAPQQPLPRRGVMRANLGDRQQSSGQTLPP